VKISSHPQISKYDNHLKLIGAFIMRTSMWNVGCQNNGRNHPVPIVFLLSGRSDVLADNS
jgi:hypothetical protein